MSHGSSPTLRRCAIGVAKVRPTTSPIVAIPIVNQNDVRTTSTRTAVPGRVPAPGVGPWSKGTECRLAERPAMRATVPSGHVHAPGVGPWPWGTWSRVPLDLVEVAQRGAARAHALAQLGELVVRD